MSVDPLENKGDEVIEPKFPENSISDAEHNATNNLPSSEGQQNVRLNAAEDLNSSDSAIAMTPRAAASTGTHHWVSTLISTLASLGIVLTLLVAVRFLLPPCLEAVRYSWYRGQLRAEHEASGESLKGISFDGLSKVSEAVSQRVTPSVVHIDVRQKQGAVRQPLEALLESDRSNRHLLGQGSGVIVDKDGYVLTNYHVLEDAELVEVQLSDRRRVRAKIVGVDEVTDLAVLKIDATDLIPIEWGDSDQITIGSSVWAVGSPFGLSGTITFGIISSKNRVDLSGTPYGSTRIIAPRYSDLLQSDVAVNPGNSGGPLVDFHGKLVGINTAILGESYRGVSFSIPSRVAKRCYEQIRANGEVQRGWLGVELATAEQPSFFSEVEYDNESSDDSRPADLPGATVLRFAEGNASPALLAGLSVGDRIVEFNRQPIQDSETLIRKIGECNSGEKVPMKVIRGQKEVSIVVTLGKRPSRLP